MKPKWRSPAAGSSGEAKDWNRASASGELALESVEIKPAAEFRSRGRSHLNSGTVRRGSKAQAVAFGAGLLSLDQDRAAAPAQHVLLGWCLEKAEIGRASCRERVEIS